MSRTRYCGLILSALAILSSWIVPVRAEPRGKVGPGWVVFTQADFLASDARRPPGDAAPWTGITLPDEWRSRAMTVDTGWYRIRFNLPEAPEGMRGIYVALRRAQRVDFYVNGKRVGGSRESNAEAAGRVGAGREATINLLVSPVVFRGGENVLHVRMLGTPHSAQIHGLGRVYFGDGRAVRRLYVESAEWGFNAKRKAIVAAMAIGVITLFLWFAHRADRLMLWLSIACLSWGVLGYAYIRLRWSVPGQAASAMFFWVTYALVAPSVVLALRTVDLKWPRFEFAVALFLVVELTYPFWPGEAWPGALMAWDAANAALLLAAIAIMLGAAARPLTWLVRLQIAAIAAMAAAIGFEIARFLGWVDVESTVVRHFHVPVMLLAIGAACFERYALVIRRAARLNTELESRVAEKTRELQAIHARIEAAQHERVVAEERERVVSDMHDGLGASLVSLLRYVQRGEATQGTARSRVRDAMWQMRGIVAALQPTGGSLTGVLAELRRQVEVLLEGGGVRLAWQVGRLADDDRQLDARIVLRLQQIIFEALGNVLKHAGATEVCFSASSDAGGAVQIRIVDNGCGFDPSATTGGLGLASMPARAASIGAALVVDSNPGGGTRVEISLPLPAPSEVTRPGAQAVESPLPVGVARRASPLAMLSAAAVVLLGVLGVPADASAASQPRIAEFDNAQFLASSAIRPPPPDAAWTPVTLPDQWRARSSIGGEGWYRIAFHRDRPPRSQQAIMVRHRKADEVAFYINGALIGTAADNQSLADRNMGRRMGSPIRFLVLPELMRAGENVLHVKVKGSSDPTLADGLGRVYFGDARAVRGVYNVYNDLGFAARHDVIVMVLAAGLIALPLWLARREDKVMFWFCATCLPWGTLGFVYLMVRWADTRWLVDWAYFYPLYGLVVPTLALSLRTVDKRWPRVELGLWLFFAFELTFPFWGSARPAMLLFWDAANTLLLLGGVAVVIWNARRPLRWTLVAQVFALVAMAVCMSHEVWRYLGWVDVESLELRHYHVPLMLFAIGAVCFDRYARAIRRADRTNVLLEEQVADKVREIVAQHEQIEGAMRERTRALERQRILADVHDGLGANLTSLLHYLDSGSFGLPEVERRVRLALQEMRIAIDALRLHGPIQLGNALGSLRYRLNESIRTSGLRFVWEVSGLPETDELAPPNVFALQRILLEAIENVLEHASAGTVTVRARSDDHGNRLIVVEDDGRGFDPVAGATGSGITRMRARAAQLGGTVAIESCPHSGTRVCVMIPRQALAVAAVPSAEQVSAGVVGTSAYRAAL